MGNTVLAANNFAMEQALIRGLDRESNDFPELTQTLYLNDSHLEKIETLMRRLGLGRRTIVNMAIKYGMELALEENPDALLEVKGFPKAIGKKVVKHELTADTRAIMDRHQMQKYYSQFVIFGINKLYAKLVWRRRVSRTFNIGFV